MQSSPSPPDLSAPTVCKLRCVTLSLPVRNIEPAAAHAVLMAAYEIEARLIGATRFPPLERTVEDMAQSETDLLGMREGDEVIGVVEIKRPSAAASSSETSPTEICSLGVRPTHFRCGVARGLVRHVIQHYEPPFYVTTGARNAPAIALYESSGFAIAREHRSREGIPLVDLQRLEGRNR